MFTNDLGQRGLNGFSRYRWKIDHNRLELSQSLPRQVFRHIRSKGYVTIGINLVSEANSLSLSEVVHAGVISVVHEVVYGWAKDQHCR